MSQTRKTDEIPSAAVDLMKTMQEASLKGTPDFAMHWMEAMSEMGSQMLSFTAARLHKDLETQHALLNAKDFGEIQHIQAQFFQRAMEDYIAETAKLMEMSRTLAPKAAAESDD